MTPPTPSVAPQILYTRAPDLLRQLATDLNVQNSFAFLPHRRLVPWVGGASKPPQVMVNGAAYEVTGLLTLCNSYVSVFTAALGCAIPPLKANDQKAKYLDAPEGKMAGWFKVNRTLAMERASLGYPTVAAVMRQPHGHIGMVMPSPVADSGTTYISAAGAVNIAFAPMVKSFGPLDTAEFYTHN